MSSYLLCHQDKHVLTLRLNRTEKKNALTGEMYQALADSLLKAQADDSVYVVVLTGGENFTAGNDLNDFINNPPDLSNSPVGNFMQALSAFPKPVVAAVDGFAVGIGSTVLLHCDLIYCSDRTTFILPFVNLGIVPEFASSQLLPMLAGHHKASELLMLGEPFDATTAQQIGLVNKVVDHSEVEQQALEVAHKLAAKPQQPIRITKAMLKKAPEDISARILYEGKFLTQQLQTEETKVVISKLLKR